MNRTERPSDSPPAAADSPSHGRATGQLAAQLTDLRGQLTRLGDLLAEQSATRKRRRRLTIRGMMVMVVLFGLVFAYYGRLYRAGQEQSRRADQLSRQFAFLMYEPRKNVMISLLPGDSQSPPASLIDWLGQDFFSEITNVSTNVPTSAPRNAETVIEAVSRLPSLKRLRLTGMKVSMVQLDALARLNRLESLDLARTVLDYSSMPWLQNARLKWFSAQHTRFSDAALADLCLCSDLQHLDLERTAVTDQGIQGLAQLPHLRYLKLYRTPVTKAGVTALSKAVPHCVIDWEPLVMDSAGRVNANACRRGRIRLGTAMPPDPRPSHQAIPPTDQHHANAQVRWNLPVYRSPNNQNFQPAYPVQIYRSY